MWIRLEIEVAPYGYNKTSVLQRMFSGKLEFNETWRSPNAAHQNAWLRMSRFAVEGLPTEHSFQRLFATGKAKALNCIPHPSHTQSPRDWRVFIYAEPGLNLELSAVHEGDPKGRVFRDIFELPCDAYPRHRRHIGAAEILRRTVEGRKGYIARVFQCFCGTDFAASEETDNISVELVTRRENGFLKLAVWLGFLGFLVAFSRTFIELFPNVMQTIREWFQR